MDDEDQLAREFEAHRGHLRAVAYRMLGSLSEADDAVQEAWLRLRRVDAAELINLGGWLTTVVGRICLDQLRSRRARREEPLDTHLPDPVISPDAGLDPEQEVLLADAVGLALLVVLETLTPAERLVFVLHDMFAVPFDEIGPIVGRSSAAAKQLASRARRRIEGSALDVEPDPGRQREVVGAFLAASRAGDFEALVAVLDPDIVLRVDGGVRNAALSKLVRGAATVAAQALTFSRFSPLARPALVNGAPGLVTASPEWQAVMGMTIRAGRIVEIDILVDPERLARLDLTPFSD